jgi:hypothetical protein
MTPPHLPEEIECPMRRWFDDNEAVMSNCARAVAFNPV